MKDYYQTLGVNEKATKSDITKHSRILQRNITQTGVAISNTFQEINEAHDTLKDSQKRHDYDTMRKFGSTQNGWTDILSFNEEIFGDFFSGFQNGDMNFGGRFNFTQNRRGHMQEHFRSSNRGNRNVQVRMAHIY